MTTERKTVLSLLILLTLAALITFWLSGRSNEIEQKNIAEKNQDLLTDKFGSLVDLDGKDFSFDSTAGVVRVVTHFASWCPACLNDLRVLNAVSEDPFFNEVQFFSLNRMEPLGTVHAYLTEVNFSNSTRLNVLVDTTDSHYKSIGGFTMPETIVYGKRGETINHWRGPLEEATLKELLKATISE